VGNPGQGRQRRTSRVQAAETRTTEALRRHFLKRRLLRTSEQTSTASRTARFVMALPQRAARRPQRSVAAASAPVALAPQGMRTAMIVSRAWDIQGSIFVAADRRSPNRTTGVTPTQDIQRGSPRDWMVVRARTDASAGHRTRVRVEGHGSYHECAKPRRRTYASGGTRTLQRPAPIRGPRVTLSAGRPG
jgi:hypothetical protein